MASCPKLYSPAGRGRASTGPYWRRMPRVMSNSEYRLVRASRISPSPPRSGTTAIRVASSTYSSQAASRSASFGFHPPLIDRTPRFRPTSTRSISPDGMSARVRGRCSRDHARRSLSEMLLSVPLGAPQQVRIVAGVIRRASSRGRVPFAHRSSVRLLHGKMEQRIPQPGTWVLPGADTVDRPAIRTEECRQLPARVARQDGQHQSVQPPVVRAVVLVQDLPELADEAGLDVIEPVGLLADVANIQDSDGAALQHPAGQPTARLAVGSGELVLRVQPVLAEH